ncbi:MAG: hypothetical protein IKV22_01920 [Paludibacteraceae bacterium]|nr:hypothetical protein [Paludibacteraceae bacterium]
MRYLCLLFLVFLASCKSLDSVQCTIDSVHHNSVSQLSTVNSQLSTIHDSIVYRERIVHDTVFITKEVYRDKQLSTLNCQLSTIADTIHVVEYRDRVVEHPPERYIPPFYKRCTIVLWIIIALGIVYLILRTKIHAFHL